MRVQIAGHDFYVRQALGVGSFGAVWAADWHSGSGDNGAAIKDILCQSGAEMKTAMREAEFIRAIADVSCTNGTALTPPRHAPRLALVPRVLAVDAQPEVSSGSSEWRVRLAMTKVPGKALDKFLEEQRAPDMEVNKSLACACRFVRELITQVGGRLEEIEHRGVFHRDAQARNILVHETSACPTFSLVDFGLAVDATGWRGGGWKSQPIAGDCRYWPTSAWVVYGYGNCEGTGASLGHEYETCLDLHSLGLTAIQSFVALLPTSVDAPSQEVVQGFQVLQAAWAKYWCDSLRIWRRVVGAFQKRDKSGMDALRKQLREERVEGSVRQNISLLKMCLIELKEVCASDPLATNLKEVPPLIDAILHMICDGSSRLAGSAPWRYPLAILQACGDDKHLGLSPGNHSEAVTVPATSVGTGEDTALNLVAIAAKTEPQSLGADMAIDISSDCGAKASPALSVATTAADDDEVQSSPSATALTPGSPSSSSRSMSPPLVRPFRSFRLAATPSWIAAAATP
jgi:serine/threonine protein kinase